MRQTIDKVVRQVSEELDEARELERESTENTCISSIDWKDILERTFLSPCIIDSLRRQIWTWSYETDVRPKHVNVSSLHKSSHSRIIVGPSLNSR